METNYKILQQLDELFKSYNVTMYLMFGTLLGFIRENKFISTDTDLDVAILKINNIKQIFKNSKNFRLVDKKPNNWVIHHKTLKGFETDIIMLEIDKQDPNSYSIPFIKPYMKGTRKYDKKFFDGYDIIKIKNYDYNIPRHVDKLLTGIYGNWRIKNHRKHAKLHQIKFTKYNVAFVNMCADLFHYGHVNFLKKASNLCKTLIVGLHSDKTIQNYKRKPIMNLSERAKVVESCKYVDKILLDTPLAIDDNFLKKHKIDIVFHGHNINEHQEKKRQLAPKLKYYKFIRINYTNPISTTKILNRIKKI